MKKTISNTKQIVPNARQSGPLTLEDLLQVAPIPAFAEGVNLAEAGEVYLAALAGKEPTGIIPGLAEADEAAATHSLRRDLRILIEMDSKVHKKQGFKTFEAYYTHVTGRKTSRSTVWRRRLRGEFALLLGAQGHPELLPSQRQCELIRKKLTRTHSTLLLLSIGDPAVLHRMSEAKLLEATNTYRSQNGLQEVGECAEEVGDECTGEPQEEIEPESLLLINMINVLRKPGAETIRRPSATAAAIFNRLQDVNAEVPAYMEVSARIADMLLKKSDGPLSLSGRSCLIHLISAAILQDESSAQEPCCARGA